MECVYPGQMQPSADRALQGGRLVGAVPLGHQAFDGEVQVEVIWFHSWHGIHFGGIFFVPDEGFVQNDGAHPLVRKSSVYSSYQLAMCPIYYLSSPCWVPVLVPVSCADLICEEHAHPPMLVRSPVSSQLACPHHAAQPRLPHALGWHSVHADM